jgi:hypothetical protein
MPSIRIGFSTDLNLVNEQVGIGTTNPTARLDVRGQIIADRTTGGGGITTLTTYDGFLQSQQTLGTPVSIASTTKGNLNSISGEIKVSAEVTVTDGTSVAGGRLDSLTVTGTFDLPSSGTLGRETTPEKGSTRFNQDLGQLEFYTGYEWRTVGSYDGSGRGRGVWGGGVGDGAANVATIDFVNISSQGNAITFGTLSLPSNRGSAVSSSIRGIFSLGQTPAIVNTIEYITIASEGNTIDFGDLTQARLGSSSFSSSTRGVFATGYTPVATPTGNSNVIDYIQISSTGNAVDFGDATINRHVSVGCASPTRGVFGGGDATPTPTTANMEFVTIASTGNSIRFGDLNNTSRDKGSCSNSTRGLFVGGRSTYINSIEFITIATIGNAVDFGDLTNFKWGVGGTSNSIRGVFAGGYITPSYNNSIDYVTISTLSNAQDFGDLTVARYSAAALSDSHGGLGGF